MLHSGTEYEKLLASLRLETPWATAVAPGDAARPDAEPTNPAPPLPEPSDELRPVWAMIDAQAARQPTAVAIAHGGSEITYAELRTRTEAGAARLRRCGIGPEDVVAVVLDRGPAFAAAVLAIWKAGAAYLPLSPADPDEWLADVIGRVGAALVVADLKVPGCPVPRLTAGGLLDEPCSAGRPAGRPGSRPEPAREPGPADLAYIICTSGSSGSPKLVQLEQRGVTALARAQQAFVDGLSGLGDRPRILQFFHPSYDAALFDLLLALVNGARLEIADAECVASGEALAGFLRDRRITHAVLPAPVVRTLAPGSLPGLRMLMSIGDVCAAETARAWAETTCFVNGYGPTETTVAAMLHVVRAPVGERVPVGTGLAGWRVYLLDDELREVPGGEAGEICIAGPGVGRGYLGRPGLTARSFVPDPFAVGGVLYRTGDLGRRLADGSVDFLGRVDDQVKVRGVRIELGQVERILGSLPGVRQAAAAAWGEEERLLVGYVQLAPGAGFTGAEIRARAARRAPRHLVPDHVEVLDQWPVLPSGKTDRLKLPRPGAHTRKPQASPRTATEQAVLSIVTGLLGTEHLGIHDDILDAGVHSLLAAQIVARIRAQLGVEVKVSAVFEGLTVARIAAACADAPSRADTASSLDGGPKPGPADDPATAHAVSYGQRRVWLMHTLDPQARAYHTQAVIRLAGPFDETAFDAALTDLVRRHDVLRGRFVARDGELTCLTMPPQPVAVPLTDLSGIPRQRHDRELAALVRSSLAQPFRLDQEPPLRWLLVRLAPDEHIFIHVEHHIVHDGWSFQVFLRELLAGYADVLRDGRVRRPPPEVQYADYTRWQEAWVAGPEAEAQRAFWRSELADAPAVLMLPGRRATADRGFRGDAPRIEVPAPLARAAEDLARRSGTSLFSVLLAAFFATLGKYTGVDDILLASAFAARRWRSVEDVIGMFVNTVVLRGRPAPRMAFADLLGQVAATIHRVLEHQDLPFEDIVDQSPVTRRPPGVNPLVQMAFHLHDAQPGPFPDLPLDVTVAEGIGNGSAKFDLSVLAVPRYGPDAGPAWRTGGVLHIPRHSAAADRSLRVLQGITLACEFNSDVLSPAVVADVIDSYLALLGAAAHDPGTSLADLPAMTGRRRHEILRTGTGPAAGVGETWVPAVIDGWASRTPLAPAVVHGEVVLSYRELTELAGRLAGRLRAAGTGRHDIVGVLIPHEPPLVVAQLGVLGAGAAYLPLDPNDVPARLRQLLGLARARALVTTAGLARTAAADLGIPVITLDDTGGCADPALAAGPGLAAGPPAHGSGADLAYVIFTSGSTGTPKGVQVEHRSMTARLLDPALRFRPGDRATAVCSPAFDLSVLGIWGPLLGGATVCLPPSSWGLDSLARHFAASRLTDAFVPSALFAEVFPHLREMLAALRRVIVGGDVFPVSSARAALEAGLDNVLNGYGPTETTILATTQPLAEWDASAGGPVPIGRPLGDTDIVIVDDDLHLVPPGAAGEICIGGPAVARGYLCDPAGTAQSFVPDPFGLRRGNRLYRTGDYGRWLPGGVLEFLGRRDDQVKIRGFRVDPAETRAALSALPDVTDAIVLVDRPPDRAARLVGYAVPGPGARIDGVGLRRRLAALLPGYLVPEAIAVLDTWPLTATGKIDRVRLPLPAALPGETSPDRAPLEGSGQVLLGLIRDELGDDRIGPEDDFFELGLDSLRILRITVRASQALHQEVSLGEALAHPTVAGLAATLVEAPADGLPAGSSAPAYPGRRAPERPFDPAPVYQELRESGTLGRVTVWDGSTPWLVTRYSDAIAALSADALSGCSQRPGYPHFSAASAVRSARFVAFPLLDDAEHRRQRAMLAAEFSGRRARESRGAIQQVVDEALDTFTASGPPADLAAGFALPVAVRITCDLLGMPVRDGLELHRLSSVTASLGTPRQKAEQAAAEMNDYFVGLVARAMRHPADDLLGRVVRPQHRAGALSRKDAVAMVQTLFHAGHGQAAFMITLGTAVLLKHPQQYRLLGDSRDERAVRAAVEELLRYITTAHTARQRVAIRELTIGSTTIHAGDGVLVQIDSANRDPAVFPDPDRFDIDRPLRRNLAFGHGPHLCLGAALARMELDVVFGTLPRRLPLLRLAVPPGRLGPRDDQNSLRLDALPVTWPVANHSPRPLTAPRQRRRRGGFAGSA